VSGPAQEAPHEEAPHEEAPHGEAPHGEAPHGEAPHGEAPQEAEGRTPLQEPAWLWLSPRSLVVRPVMDLIRLLPFLLGLLYLRSRGGSANYWGAAFAAFAIVTSTVRWLTTRYRITDERIYVRRGLLSQKVLSVARDSVRTVDLTAHVLYRILGLRRVAIGTGRNDRREGESFRLDALTLARAEELRTLLLAVPAPAGTALPGHGGVALRGTAAGGAGPGSQGPGSQGPGDAAGDVAAGDRLARDGGAGRAPGDTAGDTAGNARGAAGTGAVVTGETEIVRLSLAWIRFAPLTLTGLVILGVAFGVVAQFNDAAHVNLAKIGPVHSLIARFSALPLGPRILTAALLVAFCLVVISTVGYIAVFWHFRVVRQDEGTLRVSRGLLSTRATTIDMRRLRGVEISEPLLLRAARGARCIAITTGLRVGRGAERGGSLLLPPAPRQVAREVAAEVLGVPVQLCTGPLVRHGPAARRRRYNRAVGGSALIVIAVTVLGQAAHLPAWTWLSWLILLPLAAVLAADRYRSLGHRLTAGRLVTSQGTLVRRRSILATEGIIGWRIHQSWFQRRQGLVTLTATTAAGRQHYEARDVPMAQALAVAAAATEDLVRPFLVAVSD
jgi:putative membrane protein